MRPIFFALGAMNSGGTSTDHGLMIGAEMLSDKNPLAPTTDPLYNYSVKDRLGPPDLGYYMVTKFLSRCIRSPGTKAAALRMIIEMRDPQKILELSAYDKRFSAQASQ